MVTTTPTTEFDGRYSSPDAIARSWDEAEATLQNAEVYWLTTIRADGRPHVTPLIGIWQDGALHFCTGAGEQKTSNLKNNASCALTTGCNRLNEGFDIVVHGDAVQMTDEARLQRLADAYPKKYEGWHFEVRDGAFVGDGGRALVFAVAPETVYGFGKGEPYSQTRWRFSPE